MKLGSDPKMVAEFDLLPVGQWFRYLTGFLEAIGGITLLVPLVSVFAAILLLCVDIGAFFAQLFFLKGDVIHTFVVAAVLIAIIYLQRHQLRRSLGKLA